MEDRQQKVAEVYEQFQYKDEIIELLTQKVKLFQEEYLKKEVRESGISYNRGDIERRDGMEVRDTEDKIVQTEGWRKEQMVTEQELKEQRRVIEVYESLLRRVRGKLEEKIG